jgi:CheY-like chemotaxis protein
MNAPSTSAETDAASLREGPRHVLIVEDDADIRDALLSILRDEGYDVRGASNGQEALDQLRAGHLPSVILLDLMMPVMNGWQFRAEQRTDPRLATIPVVVISADTQARQRAESLDAVAYIKKPIELEAVLALVERYVR